MGLIIGNWSRGEGSQEQWPWTNRQKQEVQGGREGAAMMLRGQSLVLRCFLGTVPSGFHLGHGELKEPTCQLTPSS